MGYEGRPQGDFFIAELNKLYPTSEDTRRQGDDHIRLIKRALQSTFPNFNKEVKASVTELNRLQGVESNIQSQLDDKAAAAELDNYGKLNLNNLWAQAQRASVPGAGDSIPQNGTTADLGDLSRSNFLIYNIDGDIESWADFSTTIQRGATYQIFLGVTDSSPVNITWPSSFVWAYGVAPTQLAGSSNNLLTLVVRTTSWIYASIAEQFKAAD